MNGSRLGRGRGGRLAVYAGCFVGLLLLVMAYRATVTEMARLQEIHVQCLHDKESLAAQYQVISEYKMRIEKSLADEKSANVAAKQELENRASMEKTQRNRDLVEANHKYNSLDQEYKTFKAECQDYREQYATERKQASEEKSRLESSLEELRAVVKRAQEERDAAKASLENFKNVHLAVESERDKLQNTYNDLLKAKDAVVQENMKFEKHVHQLTVELENVKRSCAGGQPAQIDPNAAAAREAEGQGQDAGGANLAKPPGQQSTSTTTPRLQAAHVGDGPSKSSTKGSTQQGEKSSPGVRRVKLPAGVPPIPELELAERNPAATNEGKVEKGRADAAEVPFEEEKPLPPIADNQVADPPRQPAAQRHPGDQAQPPRQDSWPWPQHVAPGVQEIGEELSNREKIPGLEEPGIRQIAEGVEYGQYGNDYERDSPIKNNDIHLEEGEEEGEDGDDPPDYPILEGNNPKAGKNPE